MTRIATFQLADADEDAIEEMMRFFGLSNDIALGEFALSIALKVFNARLNNNFVGEFFQEEQTFLRWDVDGHKNAPTLNQFAFSPTMQ